jgi:hypothetical protein
MFSIESNQSSCTQTVPALSLQQVKDGILLADQAIIYAIDVMRKWPRGAVISLEEREKTLEVLLAVKQFMFNWFAAMSSAQNAIGEVVKAVDAFLPVVDKDEERKVWTGIKENIWIVYRCWRRYANKVGDLVEIAGDSENKWRSIHSMVTVCADVPSDVPTRLLLGESHWDLNWAYLGWNIRERYTGTEMEPFCMMANMGRRVSDLLRCDKKTEGTYEEEEEEKEIYKGPSPFRKYFRHCYHYCMDGHLAKSLYRWTLVKGATLFDSEIPLSLPYDAQMVYPLDMSKEKAVSVIKNRLLLADQAIVYAIHFHNHNYHNACVSLEEREQSLDLLVEVKKFATNLVQTTSSVQDILGEVLREVNSLSSNMEKGHEYGAWIEMRDDIRSVYEHWCRYVDGVENLVTAAVDSEEKWRSTIIVEVPATDTSLNSIAEAPKTNTVLQLLAKVRSSVKHTTKARAITRFYLGEPNYTDDWLRLAKEYTQEEIEALRAITHLADNIKKILNWGWVEFHLKETYDSEGSIICSCTSNYYMNEALVKSLFKWTQVRVKLHSLVGLTVISGTQIE